MAIISAAWCGGWSTPSMSPSAPQPLTVVGPEGVQTRFEAAAETLFPGSTTIPRRYDLRFLELTREKPLDVGAVRVTPFEVKHPSGATPYALRFELEGKVLSFTGDTEWTETLVPAGRGADLYIMECYQFEGEPRFHMSWTHDCRRARPHRRQARPAHAHGRRRCWRGAAR